MAPLVSLLLALALAASVFASPHVPRNAYNHAHRAVAPFGARADAPSLPLPARKRSLNRRSCAPRPSNATSELPSNPATPMNVAPTPSVPPASSSSSSSSWSSSWSSTSSPAQSHAPSPTPSPSPTPTPTTSSAPPAQTSASSGSSGEPSFLIGTQTGQGTYYSTGLGACGITNNDNQHIAAVSHLLFDAFPGYDGVNPNLNPVCNKGVTVTYQGKTVTVTITDRCTGCALTDLDFSPSAFDLLADPSVGRLDGIKWEWV